MEEHMFCARICCLIVLVLTAAQVRAAVVAGPVLNPANGHSYYLLSNNSWTASEAEAVLLGGHLATVRSLAENNFIFDTFTSLLPTPNSVLLIGLNDAAVEGTFIWSSGEAAAYTNWRADSPNNDAGWAGEDYASIGYQPTGEARVWNDVNNTGSDKTPFGIAEVVPEPATLTPLLALFLASARRRRTAV
jgi:hypothetical protein